MLKVAESSSSLSIYTPLWVPIVCFLFGIVLAGYLWWKKLPTRKALGPVMAVFLLFYAGWFFIGHTTTLEPAGVRVESIYGEESRTGWSMVMAAYIEERPSGRGRANYLVFSLRGGGEVEVKVTGLSAEDTVKVIDFAKARMKR